MRQIHLPSRIDLHQNQEEQNEIVDPVHSRKNRALRRPEIQIEAADCPDNHQGQKDEGNVFVQAHRCMFMIRQNKSRMAALFLLPLMSASRS